MNLGNLLQALALLVLCIFTHSEYQNRRTMLESNIQALRVQKSFSGRQSFEYLYGPDWKNVIKQKLQENKDELAVNWNTTTKKIIVILVLFCIAAFHFIRYFYIDFEEEDTYLREHYKYDAAPGLLTLSSLRSVPPGLYISREVSPCFPSDTS